MNKRPLPCVLAGFVLGEVWIWQFGGTAALAALCLAAIICIIIGVLKRSSFFILIFIGILIGGVLIGKSLGNVLINYNVCLFFWTMLFFMD